MDKSGTFCWNELLTRDVGAAKKFYADMFDWTYQDHDMGGFVYSIAMKDDEMVAGIMPMPDDMPDQVPPHWFSYIAVDDVDAEIERITAAGGTICKEAFNVGDIGRMVVLTDSSGASVALWQCLEQSQ